MITIHSSGWLSATADLGREIGTEGLLKKCLLLSLRGAIATKQSKKVRNNEANAEIASRLCLSQ